MCSQKCIGREFQEGSPHVAANPATAPGDRPREARAAARERLAGATENGSGAHVSCSEDVFRREAGDFVEGTAAARRAVAERRAARG